jgi:hypothetical protein
MLVLEAKCRPNFLMGCRAFPQAVNLLTGYGATDVSQARPVLDNYRIQAVMQMALC